MKLLIYPPIYLLMLLLFFLGNFRACCCCSPFSFFFFPFHSTMLVDSLFLSSFFISSITFFIISFFFSRCFISCVSLLVCKFVLVIKKTNFYKLLKNCFSCTRGMRVNLYKLHFLSSYFSIQPNKRVFYLFIFPLP